MSNTIPALYCKKCKCIIYSRCTNHDLRSCNCGSASIDKSGELSRILGDPEKYIYISINKEKLLDTILFYDWRLGNRNVPEEFIDGYHGKFTLTSKSNKRLFEDIVEGDRKPEFMAELMLLINETEVDDEI